MDSQLPHTIDTEAPYAVEAKSDNTQLRCLVWLVIVFFATIFLVSFLKDQGII